ncbi:MAG: hypothetical protein U5K30_11245 [Acidimicrobiales bacterium]|nr:hypothetical protein [Acidimicrobiales bacterium]
MSVEDVVQTATLAVAGQLAPREAVTILSTQARDALPDARRLRRDDPGRADDYRHLLTTISDELGVGQPDSDEPQLLDEIVDDLAEVCHALEG